MSESAWPSTLLTIHQSTAECNTSEKQFLILSKIKQVQQIGWPWKNTVENIGRFTKAFTPVCKNIDEFPILDFNY